MPSLHVVSDDALPEIAAAPSMFPVKLIVQWCVGLVAAFALGTWR